TAKVAAQYFDNFIVKQDDGLRGRVSGEVPALLKQSLLDFGVKPENIELVVSEADSIDYALNHAHEGDLLTILADNIKRSWKQVTHFKVGKDQIKPAIAPEVKHIAPVVAMSDEMSALIKGGIISDERGVRLVRVEDELAD
ncbi:MAG: hypothetical protein K2X37_12180, partial [Chitinophagaceae bacterium]|nr:hypothetical protein [Chitinophagaceae bacterium]